MVVYYVQCVSVGLIVSEGIQISLQGQGYVWILGIYSLDQVNGWCWVIDVVYVVGGCIYVQLWYVGWVLYVVLQLGGVVLVLLLVLLVEGVKVFVDLIGVGFEVGVGEMIQYLMLCVLCEDEILGIVVDYVQVVCNVLDVGFDGVELYGVNGYLINQFIDLQVNQCIDGYGGVLQNCLWFLCEVVQVVVVVVGGDCVGVCLVLLIMLQGVVDDMLQVIYLVVVYLLGELEVGYLYIVEVDWDDVLLMLVVFKQVLCMVYLGMLIYVGKYIVECVEQVLVEGWVDLIGFGCLFIVNLDLFECLCLGVELNLLDCVMFFGGGVIGFIDYLMLEESVVV